MRQSGDIRCYRQAAFTGPNKNKSSTSASQTKDRLSKIRMKTSQKLCMDTNYAYDITAGTFEKYANTATHSSFKYIKPSKLHCLPQDFGDKS